MKRYQFNFLLSAIFAFVLFSLSADAFARWEVGAKAGFDSNIDRSVDGGMSDSFMTGFLSFSREPGEDSNPGLALDLSLEGTGYAESSYLNYGMATLSPAIIFYPHQRWSVSVSPFIQVVGVKDEDQSAVAFGGEMSMNQQWNLKFYTGEYFVYTDNRADVDIYSYTEKAAGLYAGVNWTEAFWSEISYEFSRGDSFRAVGEVSITQVDTSQNGTGQNGRGQGGNSQSGTGNSPRYSEAYNEYIINEPVDRNMIGVNMGYQLTGHIFSFVHYAYTSYKGDAGTSKSHTGTIGIGYNF